MYCFNQLQLAKELSTKFYQNLGLMVLPAIGSDEPLPFKGCYVDHTTKSIAIYGSDLVGLPLDQFHSHLVVYDYLGRTRPILKKYNSQAYEPLIQPNETETITVGDRKFYKMYTQGVMIGDQWFLGSDELGSGTVISIDFLKKKIHAISHLSEPITVNFSGEDHYCTLIKG